MAICYILYITNFEQNIKKCEELWDTTRVIVCALWLYQILLIPMSVKVLAVGICQSFWNVIPRFQLLPFRCRPLPWLTWIDLSWPQGQRWPFKPSDCHTKCIGCDYLPSRGLESQWQHHWMQASSGPWSPSSGCQSYSNLQPQLGICCWVPDQEPNNWDEYGSWLSYDHGSSNAGNWSGSAQHHLLINSDNNTPSAIPISTQHQVSSLFS
jgi:hypothetical protein